ncbi:hypothetical protein WN093_12030 [Gammaproteobacteria bacterium AS21]
MKTSYQVVKAFRVGTAQRWVYPDEKVELLACEAQFPLSRGWLKSAAEESTTTVVTDVTATKNNTKK